MKTADIRLPPLPLELHQLISVVEHMVILLISVDSARLAELLWVLLYSAP